MLEKTNAMKSIELNPAIVATKAAPKVTTTIYWVVNTEIEAGAGHRKRTKMIRDHAKQGNEVHRA
jgi:hypothetical protein